MSEFFTPTRHGFVLPPAKTSLGEVIAQLSREEQLELLHDFNISDIESLQESWQFKARREQLPPEGIDWDIWLILAGRGFGKDLIESTLIMTSEGFKQIKDIEIGDTVFDEAGEPCKVTGKYSPTNPRLHRVTFSDGEELIAGLDHQWVTWTQGERKAYLRQNKTHKVDFPENWPQWKSKRTGSNKNKKDIGPQIRTTKEIKESLVYGKRGDSNHCIPLCRSLNLPKRKYKIHPWTIGYFIKDGATVLPEGRAIPEEYLWGSQEQRLELLRGLFDTNGYVTKKGNCKFIAGNIIVAKQVQQLLWSLGEKCNLIKGKIEKSYKITYTPSLFNPFSQKIKADRVRLWKHQVFRLRHRTIKSIEPYGEGKSYCLEVDSPNHMYLAGKSLIPTHNTLTGANWIQKLHQNWKGPGLFRSSVIVPTNSDIWKVIVEGESGFLQQSSGDFKITEKNVNKSGSKITWPDGSLTYMFSAEKPERLRGPQFHAAWLDEMAAMCEMKDVDEADEKLEYVWDMIQFGLRLGDNPEMLVTTTPKPRKLLRELVENSMLEDGDSNKKYKVVVSTGSTYDNEANLTPKFLEKLKTKYEGTRIGRQELHAKILSDFTGGLWTQKVLDRNRVKELPCKLQRVVIAVDPAVSSTAKSDEHGIILGGLGEDGHAYVLGDFSMKGKPRDWALKVLSVFDEHNVDLIVAEKNNGGDLVERNVQAEREFVPIKLVTATRGKVVRAEPAALQYEKGIVHHVGEFVELEEQMCKMGAGKVKKSPDRADALVWLLWELIPSQSKRAGTWGKLL